MKGFRDEREVGDREARVLVYLCNVCAHEYARLQLCMYVRGCAHVCADMYTRKDG